MNAQLTGQIVGLALLGLVIFNLLAYIVCRSVEHLLAYYYSAKLTYVKALIEMQPPDELIEMVEVIQKRNSDSMVGEKVPPPRVDRKLISKDL